MTLVSNVNEKIGVDSCIFIITCHIEIFHIRAMFNRSLGIFPNICLKLNLPLNVRVSFYVLSILVTKDKVIHFKLCTDGCRLSGCNSKKYQNMYIYSYSTTHFSRIFWKLKAHRVLYIFDISWNEINHNFLLFGDLVIYSIIMTSLDNRLRPYVIRAHGIDNMTMDEQWVPVFMADIIKQFVSSHFCDRKCKIFLRFRE